MISLLVDSLMFNFFVLLYAGIKFFKKVKAEHDRLIKEKELEKWHIEEII